MSILVQLRIAPQNPKTPFNTNYHFKPRFKVLHHLFSPLKIIWTISPISIDSFLET